MSRFFAAQQSNSGSDDESSQESRSSNSQKAQPTKKEEIKKSKWDVQSDEEYEQKDRKVISEKQKKDSTFKSIISKIKNDLNNVDFKGLHNDFEILRKEIENS